MNKDDWYEEHDLDVAGKQFGVAFTKRNGDRSDNHVLINVLSEDDESWFLKDSFSSFWINDLINVLSEAKEKLERDFEIDSSGFGYQYKSK